MKFKALQGNQAKTTPLHIHNSEHVRIAGSFYFRDQNRRITTPERLDEP